MQLIRMYMYVTHMCCILGQNKITPHMFWLHALLSSIMYSTCTCTCRYTCRYEIIIIVTIHACSDEELVVDLLPHLWVLDGILITGTFV